MAANYIQEMKSRSQKKRESAEITSLGQTLAALADSELAAAAGHLDLPDDDLEQLLEAVREARRMLRSKGGGKAAGGALQRQYRYIGKMLREVDTQALQLHLGQKNALSQESVLEHKRLEDWRDALVGDNELVAARIIEEIAHVLPEADVMWLRQAGSNARDEMAAAKPPRHSRAIFRYLRRLTEDKENV